MQNSPATNLWNIIEPHKAQDSLPDITLYLAKRYGYPSKKLVWSSKLVVNLFPTGGMSSFKPPTQEMPGDRAKPH